MSITDNILYIISGVCAMGVIGGVCLIGVFAALLQGEERQAYR